MKPSLKYQQLISSAELKADATQAQAMIKLDQLFEQLTNETKSPWWQGLFSTKPAHNGAKGLYFWGGVGRGKTLLMDIFHQSLPENFAAERVHFHRFINQVHHELAQMKNVDNPLQRVGAKIGANTRLLCLDEFVIIDIGDAMIIAGLLDELFKQGVVLVTTSNAAPRHLYKDGLQRARFMPAIELLETNCQVIELDGGEDYRLQFLQQTELYSAPHSEAVLTRFQQYLSGTVSNLQNHRESLNINGRSLKVRHCSEDSVWFDFADLCDGARSQNDYLELAQIFQTVLLTDIPLMDSASDDSARRFVLLIDILYDHRVKFICSAASSPEKLYNGKRLAFEFERTASRLIEMQSPQYLASAHSVGSYQEN